MQPTKARVDYVIDVRDLDKSREWIVWCSTDSAVKAANFVTARRELKSSGNSEWRIREVKFGERLRRG